MTANADATRRWERLVLVGFMGAGKSTVGALLASRLNHPFLDSDAEMEKRTTKTIAQLFAEDGEAAFRSLEEDTIAHLLEHRQVVIALGGGALESAATRRLLSESFAICVIHLDAPLSTMLERCRDSASGVVRPLLQDRELLIERHARRQEYYRAANLTMATDGLSPEDVVEKLLRELASNHEPNPAGFVLNQAVGLKEKMKG